MELPKIISFSFHINLFFILSCEHDNVFPQFSPRVFLQFGKLHYGDQDKILRGVKKVKICRSKKFCDKKEKLYKFYIFDRLNFPCPKFFAFKNKSINLVHKLTLRIIHPQACFEHFSQTVFD